MKKINLLICCFTFFSVVAYSGGIVTNSNQSASWVRSLSRDAAIAPDGVFYNPAGLTKLNDGFHFSLGSQSIFQSKDVTTSYTYLKNSPKKYHGEIKVPVFPTFYAVWKKDKIAVSFGFNPIGGGGGATFDDGLPSMELGIADMIPTANAFGTKLGLTATDYRRDVYFKGSSIYFGYQLGVTYQINDVVSAYLGARYVSVKNTYEGYLRNVQLNVGGTWTDVSDVFSNFATQYTNLATQATAGAAGATNISNTMGQLITNGIPNTYTLADAQTAGALNADQVAAIQAGLTAMGISTTLQIGQLQTATSTAATQYTDGATAATGASDQATSTAALTSALFNQEADVVQKGNGFAPIIGVNLSFDKLNIGLKYEFKTRIQVENDTKSDFITGVQGTEYITMFPDGAKVDADLPAMLSVGAAYKVTPKFSASAGLHYYWDKQSSYGKKINNVEVNNSKIIDNNYIELGVGLEYNLTDKLLASVGYLLAKTGVSEEYQNDISFSLTSNGVGGGFGYKLSDKIMINAGAMYSVYNKGTKNYSHYLQVASTNMDVKDSYYKDTFIVSLGLDFSF
jgi:long-chain fatty acid transport protein